MIQTAGYIVIDVTLRNGGDETKPYNALDWKVQGPSGTVHDANPFGGEGGIESGDLITGGTTSGTVSFEVKGEKGDFYVIWKPDPFDAARGVWKVTI